MEVATDLVCGRDLGSPEERSGACWRWRLALAGGLALGVALRAKVYLAERSLWLDEAMLALNLCGRSFAGLLRPLDYDQGAPVGFLLLERLAVMLLGPNELALRLVPFLAAIAALVLVARFCRDHFGAGTAVLGVLLAAVLPALISYGGEAKQYSLDVAMALLILLTAADALRRGVTPRRALGLAAVGAAALWLSHPAVLVLAGVGIVLIVKETLDRRRGPALWALGASAFWLGNFAIEYVFFLKNLNANAYLNDFWSATFLPFPPTSPSDLRQYVVITLGLFEAPSLSAPADDSLANRMGLLTAAAWLIGAIVLYRHGERRLLALLVAPLVFAMIAAMLHKYPLRFRMALFASGPILLVITSGLGMLLRSPESSERLLGRVLAACLLFMPTMHAALVLSEPPQPHGARAVLAGVARARRPGDLLLVDRASEPSFRFYQTFGMARELAGIAAAFTRSNLRNPADLTREIRRLQGYPRVWLVFSAHLPDPGGREDHMLARLLDQEGARLESFQAKGYFAHLYHFQGGPIEDRDSRISTRVRSSGEERPPRS